MAEIERPSTPPRADRRLRPPPSPKHGTFVDDFEPYSPPRRSCRSTLHSNPYSTTNIYPNANLHSLATPSKKKHTFGLGFAPSDCFSSPPASPNRSDKVHQLPPPDTPRRDNSDANYNKAAIGHLDPPSSVSKHMMLPTPSKTPNTLTPARKHSRTASMQDTARILHFQPEDPNDAMPTRSQARRAGSSKKRNGGFEIYTESHARVPALDESQDNPFLRPRASTIPRLRTPSPPLVRRKSALELEEEQAMHDAAARNEGYVYTFRGKKVFKKFDDVPSYDSDSDMNQRSIMRAAGIAAERPISKSSIKPRLLFPRNARALDQDAIADEEAETDIEMSDASTPVQTTHHAGVPFEMTSAEFAVPATPAKDKMKAKPIIDTPPTKTRATRKRNADEVPIIRDDEPADEVESITGLPTPAQSSKKKQKHLRSEHNVESDLSILPTPQRSTRKTRASALDLDSVAEAEAEAEAETSSLAAAEASPTAAPGQHRSPFDNWLRTKAGRRQGGTKRNRAGATSRDA